WSLGESRPFARNRFSQRRARDGNRVDIERRGFMAAAGGPNGFALNREQTIHALGAATPNANGLRPCAKHLPRAPLTRGGWVFGPAAEKRSSSVHLCANKCRALQCADRTGRRSVLLPTRQAPLQSGQIRLSGPELGKIRDDLVEGRNFAPGGHGE